ncbi:MAG: hypothetical protein KTR27_01945 [Leptolyngbyaceae cyanobacterium MAG.088]|nr:hypothetical protein [Leptolyngbyaceae cyanobacterium MAG.088]
MWQLTHPTLQSTILNFADTGQGKTTVTQLWQDDIRLINAISHVNWQDTGANFQFELCKTCGLVSCQPQGWVSVRKIANIVGILPAFEAVDQAAKELQDEYLPPTYLNNGAIWLERAQYEKLLELIPAPSYAQLPQLTAWEGAKLIQWESVHNVLGNIHSLPKLPPNLVIASSEGSFLEQVPIFAEILQQLLTTSKNAVIRLVSSQEHIVSFYLDIAGTPTWKSLVYDGSDYGIYLEPGFFIYV